MKHEKLRRTGNEQLTSQVEDEIANDDLYDTDLERDSADFYEWRWKMWTKFNQEDWWIAVAVYLVLSSVAFVILVKS